MATYVSETARRVAKYAVRRALGGAFGFALLLGLFVGVTGRAAAQRRPAPAAQPPQFRHIGVDDGLPSSLVSDITQDRRGFMWIGTAHGVSRYDGHHFRTYGHAHGNPASLPRDFVDQVYVDRGGTLWVVTSKGLSRYDAVRDGFVTYLRPERRAESAPAGERIVTAVREDSRGTLWVGTSRGLFHLNRKSGVATSYPLVAAARDQPHVTTLFEDRRGGLWIGAQDGLRRLDLAGRGLRHYVHDLADPGSLPDPVVTTLTEDDRGALWVGTSGGLARLDAASGDGRPRFIRFRHDAADPHSVAADRIVRLIPDRSGGVWVGTENGGLDRFDPATGRFVHHRFDPNTSSGIGSNSIWALYQDATGALWVGTYSGGIDVSTLTGPAIAHFRAVPGDSTSLSYNAVPALAEGRDGRLWIGTDGGGLNRFDPATGRFTRYTPQNTNLNSAAVVGVMEGRRGDVWVAAWGGGISEFDPRTGRFTAYSTRTSNLSSDNVYEIVEDRAGHLWLGSEDATVALFDRGRRAVTRRFSVAVPGMAPSAVQVLRELADGTLAVGLQDGGLTILDPATGRQTHYVAAGERATDVAAPVLGGDDIRALHESAPGVLWIATDNGLDRLTLSSGRVTHYGEAEGLPSQFIDGILPDGTGRLWVSTDRGLTRFDPGTGAVKTYTRSDGLQGSEFLMRAAFRARDGTLYFGGNHGFNAIRPDRLVENPRPPPVVITGLQLFNKPVPIRVAGSPLSRPIDRTDTLVLDHTQNVVTLEFAALDFTAPEKNRYAYRLDGFDREWQEVGTQYTASYTNLAPGGYTFRVRASNGDGVWNRTGTALHLVITPPVWQTWWFRTLVAVAGALATFALWRFQQRRRLEVALGRQALRDPLTGLANRPLFRERVEHALARLARAGGPVAASRGAPDDAAPSVAMLFLDLDGFKEVNDAFGHAAGDRLLQAVAARLLNATRGCDTVARFGGDEFAVLLENARGTAEANTVAERIVHALRTPIPIGSPGESGVREARIGVSVGIAFAEPAVDADALLRHADAAMYQAKAEGKGRQAVFHPSLLGEATERLALATDLADALGRGEFAVVYQPIVALESGAVQSAEALLRWHHPARGSVSPVRFIPLAETSGLIRELGRWVLEEACGAAAAWPAGADGAPIGVTVNVSGRQLEDPAFPGHVAGALAASDLAAGRLTLEITESVLMHDTAAALATLHALKALGVQLAIDDFGTGYASLRSLQQFPVDVLKIDKSFVDGIARDGHDAALARTILALAEMLELRTVAEGVEHPAQRDRLLALGCELGQGYLFARPMPDAALRALLGGDETRVRPPCLTPPRHQEAAAEHEADAEAARGAHVLAEQPGA